MAAVVLVLTVHLIRPTPALVDLEEDSILEEESMLGIAGKGSRVDADSLAAGDKQTAKRGRAAAGGGKARTRARSRGGGAALPADANDASAASAAAATPEGTSEDVLELELDSADEAESEDSESGDEPGDDEAERARASRSRSKGARPSSARPKPTSSSGEDADDDDEDKTSASNYHNCPTMSLEEAATSKRPGMEGLHTGLPRGYNRTDIFVHQRNHERVCKGEFAIHWRHVAYLPPDGFTVERTYRFRSCAVVGNGGGLRLMNLGRTIDSHDVVLRLNQAPTSAYRRFVGMKTTFRLLNRLWTAHYGTGRFIEMGLPMERGLTVVVTRSTGRGFDKMHRTIYKYRPDVAILYLSSRVVTAARRLLVSYRVRLCQKGYGPYPGGSTPSSGYVAIFGLMHMCQSVTVYGFGKDKAHGIQVPYHYYTGTGSRYSGDPVHSFSTEEHLLREMARVGLVKICNYVDGNTTAALKNNEECGFNPFLLNSGGGGGGGGGSAKGGTAAASGGGAKDVGDGGSRVSGVFDRLYGENGRDKSVQSLPKRSSRVSSRKSALDEADSME